MPKIDIAAVPERKGSPYPPPFDAPCSERVRQRPSFKTAVENWLTAAEHERYAKEPDPWPKVREILRAA